MAVFTLEVLARELQAELLRGNPGVGLSGISSLADATSTTLAPYTDGQYLPQLKASKAGAILSKRLFLDDIPAQFPVLVCDDPEIVYLNAVRLFHPAEERQHGIHPSAVIDPTAEIGANPSIGAHVVIEAGVKLGSHCIVLANTVVGRSSVLGDDCFLHANVSIYPNTKIGHRVTLHSGVVLGADGFGYKFRGGKYIKVPHVGWVELGDDVEVGANSCIDRGTTGPTRIGAGTKIDNLVQIGHNNTIGKNCILCGQAALAGSCTLEDYVVLGGNVGLADHSSMGKGSKAGAKTGIAGHIPAGQEVWGLFGSEKKKAFRSYAALRSLPDLVNRVKELEAKLAAANSKS